MTVSLRRTSTGLAVACAIALVSTPSVNAAGSPNVATPGSRAPADCTAPPGVTCIYGVPYEGGGEFVHTLDVYYPTDGVDVPSVVVIHGGSWKSGSSRSMQPEAIYLAQNGFAAFSINYTLSLPGQPSWPQNFEDVQAAARWVATHAGNYGADGRRMGILGSSAGGHLGALLDTAGREDGIPALTDVAWSGAMDMTLTYDDGSSTAQNALAQMFGCTPSVCPQTYVSASPDAHVMSSDGAMLFFNSSNELVPISGAYKMNQTLTDGGVPHTLYVFQNSSDHAKHYECKLALVKGKELTVIDDSLRWLAAGLTGTATIPTGTFC
jgi:acetyl esterase/lipase